MQNKKKLAAIISAALIIASCSNDPKVTYNSATVQRQDISTSITATGTIEPVTEVEVGTQVSGIIDKIYVDYNSEVKRGQVIAELDKTNLLSKLASAQSNLSNAQSDLAFQKANYNRFKTLYEKGLVSANDYENAKLSYDKAVQTVKVQQQAVQEAQTNLGYATITAPINGVVLAKKVEEGQTVASSMTTPTQRVSFTVDAFPDDTFEGTVTQVRQQATTESNVVTYEVVISAPNNDLKLKPGLTANVTIYTLEKNGVMAVPSKALRFTPNEAIMTKEQTIEDVQAPAKLWTLNGNTFKAHAVELGTTNGSLTEIISGIDEGTEVLVDFNIDGGEEEEEEKTGNPFMPRPRNNKKK